MFFAVANTITRMVKAASAPIISFIWNLNPTNWESESRNWEN
jgi:hypothetical protein